MRGSRKFEESETESLWATKAESKESKNDRIKEENADFAADGGWEDFFAVAQKEDVAGIGGSSKTKTSELDGEFGLSGSMDMPVPVGAGGAAAGKKRKSKSANKSGGDWGRQHFAAATATGWMTQS